MLFHRAQKSLDFPGPSKAFPDAETMLNESLLRSTTGRRVKKKKAETIGTGI